MSKRKTAPSTSSQDAPKRGASDKVINVGVLGVTGTVGQRFVELLEDHPWFKLTAIAASSRSAGKKYKEACNWKLGSSIPTHAREMVVTTCEVGHFTECAVVFSALDNKIAGPIEEAFAKAGKVVFSNAKNHRYDDDVPILIAHVNPSHLDILPHQRNKRGYSTGCIITNANCSSTGLAIALAPLHRSYGIEQLFVTTLQAISGAGYPGVASLDIVDNVVPHIGGEEPKLESEPLKILGSVKNNTFEPADFRVSAHCNRVNVINGHTECVSVKLKTKASVEEVVKAMTEFTSEAQTLKLPSAPPAPIVVLEGVARPQPRLDRDVGDGYVCTVGRVRECPLFDIKFVVCSHNTVIGAAGGALLNAELCYAKKLL
jgi:aspartate-semialdehyde dehydrogenase